MNQRRIISLSSAVSTLIITLFLWTPGVSGCTCAELTVAQQKEEASAVFLAKVLSKAKSNRVQENGVKVRLRVERVWKGKLRNIVAVYTGATDDLYPFVNLCAASFRVGRRYLVFTYGKDTLVTDVCAGTTGFPYARQVIRELDNNGSSQHQRNK